MLPAAHAASPHVNLELMIGEPHSSNGVGEGEGSGRQLLRQSGAKYVGRYVQPTGGGVDNEGSERHRLQSSTYAAQLSHIQRAIVHYIGDRLDQVPSREE